MASQSYGPHCPWLPCGVVPDGIWRAGWPWLVARCRLCIWLRELSWGGRCSLEGLLGGAGQPVMCSSLGSSLGITSPGSRGGEDSSSWQTVFSSSFNRAHWVQQSLCVRSQAWSIGGTQRGERGERIFVNFLPCGQQAKVRSVWSPWGISARKAHPAIAGCVTLSLWPDFSVHPSFLGVKWRWYWRTRLIGLAQESDESVYKCT